MYITQHAIHGKSRESTGNCRLSAYFGQPSGGFFFSNDFLIARFHSPDSLSMSGFGPVLADGRGGDFFFAFFIVLFWRHVKSENKWTHF
jgi:hypothetical protein